MSVEHAKAVIREHEALVAAADLEGVMRNMDADIAFLVPDTPPIEGIEAIRGMYESLFATATWAFGHDYSHASEAGGLVFLHGIARGTMTPHGQPSSPMSNNFMITMRKDSDGRYRIWRAAVAPSGE